MGKPPAPTRLNSSTESQGAEFLVLGHLLIEGVSAYKHYVNGKGYDIVAVDPITHRSALIQVKSRWATNAYAFLLKYPDGCDFVVFVRLNRGKRVRSQTSAIGKADPTFHVVPAAVAKSAMQAKGWGKVKLSQITNADQYKNAWHLVRDFLNHPGN